MPYLIGTDEAGYAPNLGPLVISASVWWVDDPTDGADLYQRLKGSYAARRPARRSAPRLAIADSKALYSPAIGLHGARAGRVGGPGTGGPLPDDWLDVWQMLDRPSPGSPGRRCRGTSITTCGCRWLPTPTTSATAGAQVAARLRRAACGWSRCQPGRLSRAIQSPRPSSWATRARCCPRVTLELVADMLRHCATVSRCSSCATSTAGETSTGGSCSNSFPIRWSKCTRETNAESVYRWGRMDERIEVCFRAGGEAFMPAALASMTSKYLRELAMRAFNDFWCARVRTWPPRPAIRAMPGGLPTRFAPSNLRWESTIGICGGLDELPVHATPFPREAVNHVAVYRASRVRRPTRRSAIPRRFAAPADRKGRKQFRRAVKKLVRRGFAPQCSPPVRWSAAAKRPT